MTRGQYIVMCIIGGVALVAYLESQRIAGILNAMFRNGGVPIRGDTAI